MTLLESSATVQPHEVTKLLITRSSVPVEVVAHARHIELGHRRVRRCWPGRRRLLWDQRHIVTAAERLPGLGQWQQISQIFSVGRLRWPSKGS
jgi:hypothetical protein